MRSTKSSPKISTNNTPADVIILSGAIFNIKCKVKMSKSPETVVKSSPFSHKSNKKYPIGSCHYAPQINYNLDYEFFTSADIPPAKKLIHDEIQRFIDPDILGLKRRDWMPSSQKPKMRPEDFIIEEELIKVKLGVYDYKKNDSRPKTAYVGTDSRDIFRGKSDIKAFDSIDLIGWNVSTYVDSLERKKMAVKQTQESLIASREINKNLKNYESPVIQAKKQLEQQRELKAAEKSLRDSFRAKYVQEHPDSSVECCDGVIWRQVKNYKIDSAVPLNEEVRKNLTFHPNIASTQKEEASCKTYTKTLRVLRPASAGAASQDNVYDKITEKYRISTKKALDSQKKDAILSKQEEARVEQIKQEILQAKIDAQKQQGNQNHTGAVLSSRHERSSQLIKT